MGKMAKGANILRSIKNMTGRYYLPIWDNTEHYGEAKRQAFELCNRIRKHIGVPEYSWHKFDEGFQYRTIFHDDFNEAKDEFLNLVFGWW